LNRGFVPPAEPVSRLIEEFNKLPGIGPKSAARLAYHLLRMPEAEARSLAEAIIAVKEKIVLCSVCQNISDCDPCAICRSERRDQSMVCVVEEPLDILALERTGQYQGLYHVLHGILSPIDGVGPEDINIARVEERVRNHRTKEVIIATNPSVEGDATALYIARALESTGCNVTRLARGLPVGGSLEYVDDLTLARAIERREKM